MRKYLYLSIAALALASCSNDEFLGTSPGQSSNSKGTGEAIGFGGETLRPTRAQADGSEAAEKLNGNFIVYGFKTSAAEEADGSVDNKVFDLYNVNYTAGTANTTESNTANWEYVGYQAHQGSSEKDQTIKYWDYSAEGYVFSAVSGTGITATKTTSGTTVYDKGWTVEIPAGGSLSDLYASDRLPVAKPTPAGTKYDQVTLTFRALGTKIRFAMYETVPGYKVHVDKFYYNSSSWANTETNFAINGTFRKANSTATTPLTVTYYDDASGIENRPKVTYDDANVDCGVYGIFGTNIQNAEALGTNSTEATYDQEDKSYTMILPYESSALSTPVDNVLELYVDYTLTSVGGSGEKIEVKHASAKVPTNFNQWKPNFAYTYIFKISDNSNGTTGGTTDPNDPTSDPTDPAGLFPITFDAVVITDEEDVQETITSVSEPSITTYQKGIVVTENDEYVEGQVYYTIMNNGVLMNTAGGVSKVYEVNNFTPNSFETVPTEAIVDNYLNNFCVLTEVPVDFADNVPLTNGTNLTFDNGKCLQFTAEAGKTYAIMYDYNNGAGWKKAWKVVKVSGSLTDPSFTLAQTDGSNPITTVAGKTVLTLKEGTVGVIGAKPNFKVTSTGGNKALVITPTATDGVYDVTVDPAAIYAGKANDTYTVDFEGKTVGITVNIANALTATAVTVTAGNATGANTTFTIAGALSDDGVIVNENKGITIDAQGSGVYKVTADANVAYKAAGYDATIGGVALKVNVDSYAFASDLVITKALTGTDTGVLTLKKNGSATGVAVAYSALNGNDAIATGADATDGEFTLTAVAGGSFDVTYENATAKVTVNAYTITAADALIAARTEFTTLGVTKNGEDINAAAGKVIVTATIGGSNVIPTAGADYSLTTNGSKLIFKPSVAGSYNFTYVEDGKQVAVTTVTVTE
ncbi:MAG: hypothetical protein KBT20_01385 [Bacteroidales bacterium]|nr:hypothetical protein [Candidatus Liminaster caballi]